MCRNGFLVDIRDRTRPPHKNPYSHRRTILEDSCRVRRVSMSTPRTMLIFNSLHSISLHNEGITTGKTKTPGNKRSITYLAHSPPPFNSFSTDNTTILQTQTSITKPASILIYRLIATATTHFRKRLVPTSFSKTLDLRSLNYLRRCNKKLKTP